MSRESMIDNPFADPKFDGGIFPGYEVAARKTKGKTKEYGGMQIETNPDETVIGTRDVIQDPETEQARIREQMIRAGHKQIIPY